MTSPPDEQLALVALKLRRSRTKEPEGLAELAPVAQVVVAISLPHLDRTFDYSVPASMAEAAQPGVRVRVRFAGRLVDGWVVARADTSDSSRTLARLERVVSPDPVLAPEILALGRAVADRYAGVLTDVLRAAVPPRHAATEATLDAAGPATALTTAAAGPAAARTIAEVGEAQAPESHWSRYDGGAALLERLGTGNGAVPRVAWTALPGEDWAVALAELTATVVGVGRGAVLVVPDARDVRRLDSALTAVLGKGRHAVLSAERSPAARYRAFLRVRRGLVQVAIGTRAAGFAPVANLGLLALWDDGDDSLADPRAPYWHAREVLSLRAQQSGSALVIGSYARSVDVARSVGTGWLVGVSASRALVRAVSPRVHALGGDGASDAELARDPAARSARLPHGAWEVAREALKAGPVLVQVPRGGYLPALSCQRCRQPARCAVCAGPLQLLGARAVSQCGWCGHLAGDWHCTNCGDDRLRATATGVARTAEELGRAFRGVPVVTSGRDATGAGVIDNVPERPALVVATPGAEPVAAGGYVAALLLDGRLLLDRPDLRAGEEAVRRWASAIALVRTGGTVMLMADASLAPVQAMVRHDAAGYADRELAERSALRLPPASRVAELVGAAADVESLLALTRLPASARVLGPVLMPALRTTPVQVRALVSVPTGDGAALAKELHNAAAIRSASKAGGPVTTRIDPAVLT